MARSYSKNQIGALLDDVPQPGQTLKICGSAMLVQADSREEVLQVIRRDVYSKNGVWDLEKMQIYPVSSCVWVTNRVHALVDAFAVQVCFSEGVGKDLVRV